MSKEKRSVPKLRFPGFTEDWEQRKLSQITTRVTRKNGEQSDLPLTISAQDGLVDQRKYFNRQVASRDMSNYYLIKKGEFAYNKSYSEGYPFGAVKRLDYYDIGALSTLYILFEITDKNISSDFIVSYYMTHLWYKEISKRAAEGARNHGLLNISTEDFFDSELNIPNNIEEQVKIGNFIKQFDKFITLHQRKLEHLNLKKKALLQKLFPKNGERYPELRFPGFTDAWEQRKLSEVTTCFDNLRVPVTASDRVPGKIPYYGANGIQDYVSGHTHSGEFVLIAEDGANDLNDYPIQYVNGAIWVNNHAHVVAGYKEKLENKFLSYSLKTVKMTTFIVGGGRSKLNLKALLEIPISMPNYDEQCVIGKFIETIDKNITLHQRKLEHLQLQKKALLQQMFV